MQKTESRNELLQKWRIEKGKPPRSEIPWMPIAWKTNPSANSSFQVEKRPREVAKLQCPEEAKPIHTNFLKRRSGMVKWSHFGYSEDIKRRRVSSRLGDKENANLNSFALINASGKIKSLQVKQLNETPSIVGKETADKNTLIKKTRRDLLNEWKAKPASKNVSEDSKRSNERRQTISMIPLKRKTSSQFLRRQTMILSKKAKVQLPLDKLPAKEPAELHKSSMANLRRQTMTIQSGSMVYVPKKAVANSSEVTLKSARIPQFTSQPDLKHKTTKEVQPGRKMCSNLHTTGETKREEQKTASSAGINVAANKTRKSLSLCHRKATTASQSDGAIPSATQRLIASKGALHNARSVHATSRNHTSLTALASQKNVALQSKSTSKTAPLQPKPFNKTLIHQAKPSNKNVAIPTKPANKNVSLQARPSSVAVTIKPAKGPESKSTILQHMKSRPAARRTTEIRAKPMLNCSSKVNCPPSNVPQFCLPFSSVDTNDQPLAKSAIKSNLRKLKPALNMPSNRKSVAFEIPVNDRSSCKRNSQNPSLRLRLSSWLESQGHTHSTYRHLHCFGVELSELKRQRSKSLGVTPTLSSHEMSTSDVCHHLDDQVNPCNTWLAGRTPLRMINNDETPLNATQQDSLLLPNVAEESSEKETEVEMKDFEEALGNLSILLDNSYALQEATEWLDAMFEKTQTVCQLAAYWECRAKISELGNDPAEALALLTEGAKYSALPLENLDMQERLSDRTRKSTLDEITISTSQRQKDIAMNTENVFSSTLIKYIVKEQSPISKKLWPDLRGETLKSLVTVTPVRRTHRRSSCSVALTPASASKCSTVQCFTSLEDIPDEMKCRMMLLPNPPLKMLLESPQHVNSHNRL